jgi:tether containing UBX domain for GLUT4
VRLSGLAAGAKLELIRTSSAPSQKPISVVLRTVDPVSQLSGTFLPSTSIWGILRKLEADARAAGNATANITERCAPSGNHGQGRLLYVMPAVRVVNRELASFAELRKTLQELGCGARELLVLRFVQTEMPYEDALMEIAGLSKEAEAAVEADCPTPEEKKSEEPEGKAEESKEDTVMTEGEGSAVEEPQQTSPANETIAKTPAETTSEAAPAGPSTSEPKIAVYQPSTSSKPAAADFEVPESAYEVGIAQLQKMKESYHTMSLPQRLPSDKELAEKEAIMRSEMEKINTLKIKVRYPDGYISQQELDGKATARDLYNAVRTTLRYPNEPFVLRKSSTSSHFNVHNLTASSYPAP